MYCTFRSFHWPPRGEGERSSHISFSQHGSIHVGLRLFHPNNILATRRDDRFFSLRRAAAERCTTLREISPSVFTSPVVHLLCFLCPSIFSYSCLGSICHAAHFPSGIIIDHWCCSVGNASMCDFTFPIRPHYCGIFRAINMV